MQYVDLDKCIKMVHDIIFQAPNSNTISTFQVITLIISGLALIISLASICWNMHTYFDNKKGKVRVKLAYFIYLDLSFVNTNINPRILKYVYFKIRGRLVDLDKKPSNPTANGSTPAAIGGLIIEPQYFYTYVIEDSEIQKAMKKNVQYTKFYKLRTNLFLFLRRNKVQAVLEDTTGQRYKSNWELIKELDVPNPKNVKEFFIDLEG
jgi:hypothetical protein